jgi:mitochondrial fission protein ELM1
MQLVRRLEQPLKGLLLSDGRPGNYHLAEGLIAAIGRIRPVEVERLTITRRQLVPNRVLAFLAHGFASPRTILRLGYGIDPDAVEKADFVVSAGGDTIVANVVFAKLFGARNYFYGSFRYFDTSNFDLIFTSHADSAKRPRHVRTLKPSPIDPDSLPPQPLSPTEPPKLIGLLIGGNTSSIRFSGEDLAQLVTFMSDTHSKYGTKFYVSNSRRTPPEISDALALRAAEANGAIYKFIDVRKAGSGTLRDLYANSAAILCTADSSSMVSEAIWLRRPVIAITPGKCVLPEDESEYRNYLESNGWTLTQPIAGLSPAATLADFRSLKPIASNGLDVLAEVFLENQPELFSRETPIVSSMQR